MENADKAVLNGLINNASELGVTDEEEKALRSLITKLDDASIHGPKVPKNNNNNNNRQVNRPE